MLECIYYNHQLQPSPMIRSTFLFRFRFYNKLFGKLEKSFIFVIFISFIGKLMSRNANLFSQL